jgi:hypothetical protein
MELTKIEQEYNEFFTHDGCEFQRSTEATYIGDNEISKTRWLYKQKPDEKKEGSAWSHWLYCSEQESKELEEIYKLKNK